MRLLVLCLASIALLFFWILSHFFLYTTTWNETSYLIGLDSVSGSIRVKFGRAIGGANSGSYTEVLRLEATRDRDDEPTNGAFLSGSSLTQASVDGTIIGASDFLRPFEIDSSFESPRSFHWMATIPYWVLFLFGIALVVFERFRKDRLSAFGNL